MQPKHHINLLDNYAKESYGTKLEGYKDKFKEYQHLQAQLENLKMHLI